MTNFKVCPQCSLVALTGTINNQTDENILLQDLVDTQINQISIPAQCVPALLALSQSRSLLSWSCPDRIYIYKQSTQTTRFLSFNFTDISSLEFLDDTRLISNLNGSLTIINITENAESADEEISTVTMVTQISASQNVYAVNYQLNFYANLSDPSTVQIFSFEGVLLESFTINNTQEVSSLSFNQKNELYLSTVDGTVIALTDQFC